MSELKDLLRPIAEILGQTRIRVKSGVFAGGVNTGRCPERTLLRFFGAKQAHPIDSWVYGGFTANTHDALTTSARTAAEKEVFQSASALFHLPEAYVAVTSGGQQTVRLTQDSSAFLRGTNLGSGCEGESGPERILVLVNTSDSPRPLELALAKTGLEN